MKKNYLRLLLKTTCIAFVCFISITSSVFAVWWNPLTWFNKKTETVKITPNSNDLHASTTTDKHSSFTIIIYLAPGVSDQEAAVANKAVNDYYSLTPTIQRLDASWFTKNDKNYNFERNQYKVNSLWKTFSRGIDPETGLRFTENKDRRYVILLADDMNWDDARDAYKFLYLNALVPSAPIIISTAQLKQNVTETVFSERLTKLVVRTLGVSFGLTYSSTENQNCIYYQTTTVEELDKTGKDLCKNSSGSSIKK